MSEKVIFRVHSALLFSAVFMSIGAVAAMAQSDSSKEFFLLEKRKQVRGVAESFKSKWACDRTAVIICDMWDAHHCYNAVGRVNELAPRIDNFAAKVRAAGGIVIHAPSSCVNFYKDHAARKNVTAIQKSQSIPEGINAWCDHIPAEKDYPLDQSDGGEDDSTEDHQKWAQHLKSIGRNPRAPWTRQVESIAIEKVDYISDNGEEIWSVLDHKKIDHVFLVGVHTNMCVLGRPFGLRQLSKNGKDVVLVRDLTDTMYNPARWPFVDHFQGNRLITRHIEKYVCPTVSSDQILGGEPLVFKNDRPKKCLILCAESLYQTADSLQNFRDTVLVNQLGFQCEMIRVEKGVHKLPEMIKKLGDADLVILSMRRRSLPQNQLAAFKSYLKAGKPLVAIRTSSHALDTKGKHPEGHAEWPEFDQEVLGCDYTGHYANELLPKITTVGEHTILTGVQAFQSGGSLYQSSPLSKNATLIVQGQIDGKPAEPVAWTHHWNESRVFYTSLGHSEDFANPNFRRLLENGVRWATKMKIGPEPSRKK